MTEKRVLPADVYDTLELSALIFGGIGAGDWFEDMAGTVPICISGHALFVCDLAYDTPMRNAMLDAELSIATNDTAVPRINRRKGKPESTRVSWDEYCAELNIVRGK